MSTPSVAYLDHAATTPMVAEVIVVLTKQLDRAGNPSSLHGSGRAARRVVEESRESIARALNARPSDVVFTSGGTEADNLAVHGIFAARRDADPRRTRILTPAIEHHAVLDTVEWLAGHAGAKVEYVAVDATGRLDLHDLHRRLDAEPDDVALVSCMWANNEIGTVQPIAEIVAAAHAHGIPVHSDAVQAVGQVPVDFDAVGLDAMTVTAHKLGGPVGVGALVVRREIDVSPLLHGGGQERQIRSGTLATASIAAFAAAIDLAVRRQPDQARRLEELRSDLVRRAREAVPDLVVNGDPEPGPEHRLPGLAHLGFPGCEGDSLLMLLDAQGVECSTGSACTAGVPQASHVLLAIGQDEAAARGSLRFSLGHSSTAADVDAVIDALPGAYERARAAGLTGVGGSDA
ncbi:MAG TPA: cysteine desulfurase family protein [Nocardioidaceae bacterium]|nr:cysteine desulfurase family protein [Nocardioidaceae bacterium]